MKINYNTCALIIFKCIANKTNKKKLEFLRNSTRISKNVFLSFCSTENLLCYLYSSIE